MKKIILSFLLLLIVVFVYPQRKLGEVTYDIIRNDPDAVNNKSFFINLVTVDGSKNWFGISGGLGGFYNFNNKFVLDLDIRMSYVKPGSLFKNFEPESSFKHEPYGGIKRLFAYEAMGYLLIGDFYRQGNSFIVLEDNINSTSFTKIKIKKYFSFPLRFGIGHYRTTLFNDEYYSIELKGYDIKDASKTVESLEGSSIYSNYTINVGIGLFEITDVKVDFFGAFSGMKDISLVTTYYFDFMFPIKQNFSDMIISTYDDTIGDKINKQYHIDEHTTKTPFGFRLGYKFHSMKSVSSGAKLEIGVLPGPNNFKSNTYFSASLFFGISPQ